MTRPSTAYEWLTRLGSLALCAIGLWILGAWIHTKWTGYAESSVPLSAGSTESLESRDALARAACERTRARVQHGGTVTPADVDGWQVELLVLRPQGARPVIGDPALDSLLSARGVGGQRLLAPGTVPELASARGPDTGVTLHDASLHAQANTATSVPGARFVFTGRYVGAYFGSDSRRQYFRLAQLVAERLGANRAALFATCRHETNHYLGSWFRGSSPADALTALIVGMGLFAVVPEVDTAAAGDVPPYNLVSVLRIEQSTRPATVADLAIMLRPSGGVVTGRGGQPITLTFPFEDGNRAARASRAVAQSLGLLGETKD